jgi:sigma-B regulation protein RsbU (phosphoserine phosphatase)
MPSLIALRGPSAGKRYELREECTLGRSFNSDIYIGDLNVSRRHARIHQVDGNHVIEDLGSGNGTFVNDSLVERHALHQNDIVRIGGSSFRYERAPTDERWSREVLTVMSDIVEPETGDVRLDAGTTAQLERVAQEQQNLSTVGQERALKMLQAMYAVADVIASELDLPKLLDKVLDHVLEVFPQAERGFVLLTNAETGQLAPEAVRQRTGGDTSGLKFSQTIVDQVMSQRNGVIRGATVPPPDAPVATSHPSRARPARVSPNQVTPPDRQLLAEGETFTLELETPKAERLTGEVPKMGAPLLCRGEALGTLHIEGIAGSRSFSPEDLSLLSAIARQAATAIANARASQSLIVRQRLENDLQMARRIQESFLPSSLPRVQELEFETHYLAAQQVGGDFFDIVQLRPSLFGIMVGDISGKGVSAALLMARLTTAIRLFAQSNPDPALVMNHANRTLLETEQDAMFATVLFILLDLESRTFTVANAGHQPPMVCSHRFKGVSELDDATAVALGVLPETTYPQEVYQLVPGDVVMLYTDGINEALNLKGREYGMKRLRQVVACGPAEPKQLVHRVVGSVKRFAAGAPQSDDQTLLAFGIRVRDTTGPLPAM